MSTAFAAMVRLGSGSVIAVMAGVILGKVQAVVLGPEGVARYSLLQTVVALTMIPASIGMAQALTRVGAIDAKDGGPVFAATRRAAAIIRSVAGIVCLVGAGVLAGPICTHLLGGQVSEWELVVTLVAIAGNLVVGHDISMLAAAQRVRALARFTLADALAGAAAAGAVIVIFGSRGIAPSILIGALVAVALSRRAVRTALPRVPASNPVGQEAGALLRVGGPYTVAMLMGAAVTSSIPILTLHLLSAQAVGYYQVSTMVATGYLGFLAVAMAQDYFPRLSAARATQVGDIVNHQQRLVVLVSLPLILFTIAAAPLILHLAFSRAFEPAASILRWQALADMLRFSGWTLAYAVLARLPMRWYLASEAIGGATMFLATIAAVHAWGAAGLGIAWVATYSVYYTVVAVIAWRRLGIRYTAANRRLLPFVVVSMVVSTAASATGSPVTIAAIVGPIAAAWGAYCAHQLIPEVRSWMRRSAGDTAAAPAV